MFSINVVVKVADVFENSVTCTTSGHVAMAGHPGDCSQ
jgi:hypothetical protein